MAKIGYLTVVENAEYAGKTLYEVVDYDYLGCGFCENGESCYFKNCNEAIAYAEKLYTDLDFADNRYISVTTVIVDISEDGTERYVDLVSE